MNQEKEVFLYPSTIYADRQPCRVTTVLGSCVAICLWDSKLKFGGINHYMLGLWNGEGLASPKFGNIGIEKLVKKMLHLGAKHKNLQAKIFGGAEMFESTNVDRFKIGEINIKVAVDMMREEKIPIANFSVGGKRGRKIIYFTKTGEVFMKYVSQEFPLFDNIN